MVALETGFALCAVIAGAVFLAPVVMLAYRRYCRWIEKLAQQDIDLENRR